MTTDVKLTPELERFARDCVARGRYADVSDVVRSALRLLQDAEEGRGRFEAMLAEVERESDREGAADLQATLREMDAVVDARGP